MLNERSDLGLLKRDKSLQVRYMKWAEGIRAEYGSVGELVTSSYHLTPCREMLSGACMLV